jgi:hypothetical protein
MGFSNIIKKISIFIMANFLILLHLSWRIVFHQPMDLLNIIMTVFLWLIILNPRQKYIVVATYTLLVCELFYTSPFGIESFAQISALLLANWLLLSFFTNRSLIIIFFTSLITMIVYRLIFIFLIYANSFIKTQPIEFSPLLLKMFFNEALVTAITLSVIYIISSIFVKRLRPEYILETSRII